MLGIQRSTHLFVQSAQVHHGQRRVSVARNRAKRLKSRFWRPTNSHIECCVATPCLEERNKRLFGLVPKPAVTEVGHNADDLDTRLHVRSGTDANAQAHRTPSVQKAFHKRLVHDCRTKPHFARRSRIAFVEVPTSQNLNAHSSKESRRDGVQIHSTVGYYSLVGLNRHRIVPTSASQQGKACYGGHLRNRRVAYGFVNAANQAGCLRFWNNNCAKQRG